MSTEGTEVTNQRTPEGRRYALVVVVEAESPKRAWESVAVALGLSPLSAPAPECVYLGAPWEGVPFYAEDLVTERLQLAMSVPDGFERMLSLRVRLRPSE